MDAIWELVKIYGIPALIISLSTIFIIGVLKFFNLFNKVQKDWKKAIFYTLDIAFAFGGAAIYYAIFKMPFTNYVWFSLGTNTLTIALYALYENYGARKLLKTVGNFIVSKVANEQVKNAVKNITDAIPEEKTSTDIKK